ncbi:unnamed protein product [Sphenostylis stenocarpa]|uniref:Uncharacterized protein n=1 Tax=Sphenostylis stenocarpa TaxID=92480 RepID=A0AA86VL17_9FABA|nr:unnamed protein product [Sphenostylis stenocarpa]
MLKIYVHSMSSTKKKKKKKKKPPNKMAVFLAPSHDEGNACSRVKNGNKICFKFFIGFSE